MLVLSLNALFLAARLYVFFGSLELFIYLWTNCLQTAASH